MNRRAGDGRAPPRLVWAHRGAGTDLWLRLELPEPTTLWARRIADPDGPGSSAGVPGLDDPATAGASAVLLSEVAVAGFQELHLAVPEVAAALRRATGGDTAEARFALVTGDGIPLHADRDAAAALRAIPVVVDGAAASVEVRAGRDGTARLRLARRAPWLEIAAVRRDGQVVVVTGHLRGVPLPHEPHRLTAALVDRDDGDRLPVPVELHGEEVRLRIDLAAPPASASVHHRNVVVDVAGTPVRAAAFADDLVGKHRLVLTDPWEAEDAGRWWTTTVRYTDHDHLVVTTTAARDQPPGDPLATWEVEHGDLDGDGTTATRRRGQPVLRAVLRAALGLLAWWAGRARRRAPAAPASGVPPPADGAAVAVPHRVHLLLANLHAAGGTVRATANLANALADRADSEVHLVSVYRLVRRRYVTVVPEVRTRVLVDAPALDEQARRGPIGWLQRRLHAAPSVLIPADDPRAYRFSLLSDVQLVRWLRGVRCGTIVTTRAGLSVTAARFARPGVRVVAQQHVPFETQTPALQTELMDSYRRVDAVCVLTEADAALLRAPLAAAGTTVRVLPNPLEEVPGGPPPAPLTARTIICGGRISPVKGTDLLIAAFARLAEHHPGWELRIHGSARADRLAAAQHLVRTHGLHDRVRLLPPTPRFDLELAKASVCAVPSRHEAFGMVIIEALQAGVPVVAFDCPVGPAEILTDGRDGLLVLPQDVDAFARALDRLLQDAELRHGLAAAGHRRAADFSPAAVADAFVTLLRGLEPAP